MSNKKPQQGLLRFSLQIYTVCLPSFLQGIVSALCHQPERKRSKDFLEELLRPGNSLGNNIASKRASRLVPLRMRLYPWMQFLMHTELFFIIIMMSNVQKCKYLFSIKCHTTSHNRFTWPTITMTITLPHYLYPMENFYILKVDLASDSWEFWLDHALLPRYTIRMTQMFGFFYRWPLLASQVWRCLWCKNRSPHHSFLRLCKFWFGFCLARSRSRVLWSFSNRVGVLLVTIKYRKKL